MHEHYPTPGQITERREQPGPATEEIIDVLLRAAARLWLLGLGDLRYISSGDEEVFAERASVALGVALEAIDG